MSLDETLADAASKVPECLAAGYVDMSTGLLLGVSSVDSHPQEILDIVAAGVVDLFQGDAVVAIEDHFRKAQGKENSDHHCFQEIIVFSENLLHVFIRSKKYPEHVIVFVTRNSVNIAVVLTKVRAAIGPISAVV